MLAAPGISLADLAERRAIAHHEAGHAVLHVLSGRRIERIELRTTIEPGGAAAALAAQVFIAPVVGRASVALCGRIEYATAIAAGPAAHSKYLAGNPLAMDMFSPGDRALIFQAAEPDDPAAFMLAAIQRAAAALERPAVWRAVLGLGDALDAYWPTSREPGEHVGEMDGATAHEIIAAAPPRLNAGEARPAPTRSDVAREVDALTGELVEGGWVGSLVERLVAVDLPIPKARPAKAARPARQAKAAPVALATDEARAPPKGPAKPQAGAN